MRQQCRMMCPPSNCPANQCFMKTDNCCGGQCEEAPQGHATIPDYYPSEEPGQFSAPSKGAIAAGGRCTTGWDESASAMGAPCAEGLQCEMPGAGMMCAGTCYGTCAAAATTGNAACWSGAYDFARCCSGDGDASCWSGRYTSTFCCTDNGH
jgi:hypothetical protein